MIDQQDVNAAVRRLETDLQEEVPGAEVSLFVPTETDTGGEPKALLTVHIEGAGAESKDRDLVGKVLDNVPAGIFGYDRMTIAAHLGDKDEPEQEWFYAFDADEHLVDHWDITHAEPLVE